MFRARRRGAAEPGLHGVGRDPAIRGQENRGTQMTCRLIVAAALASCASVAFGHALKPKGEPAATLTVVQDGKPLYTIALPAQPTPREKKAAEDLQHWAKEMTGATLPLGYSQQEIRIATDKSLADEAYRISVNGDDLGLSGGGGPRGGRGV